ncbi:MAG: alpha-ketoglutarate-dependent dioxygenase AlkB family protein [Acidimicrobiales bacterium]
MARLIPRDPEVVAPGAVHLPGWLDIEGQRRMVAACRAWAEAAGGFRAPRMPNGNALSVQMTCLGWHWFPYRYSRTLDDGDGGAVAPFPGWLGELGAKALRDARDIDPRVTATGPGGAIGPGAYVPDVALVNWYGPGARMGMHADRDERSPAPVVSLSVGDSCVFRFGNVGGRGRPWTDVHLESGDLFVFGGPSRLAYHGVPNVLPGTAEVAIGLDGGRINVTIRETGLGGPCG